jgi:adenosylcobinamide-GDP ribazoletransferase
MLRVSGLLVAARYLTIVPLPGRDVGLAALGRAAPWFPVVGLALGLVLTVIDVVVSRLFPPLLAGLLVVTGWKLLTGGLHLDGLADCLDGLVGRDPAHRLAIMQDSRIGALGAVGLILFLLLEVSALAEIVAPLRWRALVVAPAIGRTMPPLLARLFPAARAHGHGAAFRAGLRPTSAPSALVLGVLVAVAGLGPPGVVAAAVGALVAVALGGFLATRLSGLTGDALGASIETTELVVLLTVSAWVHLRL